MELNKKLKSMYNDYYNNEVVLKKRKIAARQTISHLREVLPNKTYKSIVDIGAGDGSVLEEINETNISESLHALEISKSGYETILQKKINHLKSVNQFDGYTIPTENHYYELGLAVHVLEHVEHEWAFLKEIARSCEFLYIEVPLELTINIKKNITTGAKFGHINFYNTATFRNLLESSNLEVISLKEFSATTDYEEHLSGKTRGMIKYFIKNSLLNLAPNLSPKFITYMCGAYCKSPKS